MGCIIKRPALRGTGGGGITGRAWIIEKHHYTGGFMPTTLRPPGGSRRAPGAAGGGGAGDGAQEGHLPDRSRGDRETQGLGPGVRIPARPRALINDSVPPSNTPPISTPPPHSYGLTTNPWPTPVKAGVLGTLTRLFNPSPSAPSAIKHNPPESCWWGFLSHRILGVRNSTPPPPDPGPSSMTPSRSSAQFSHQDHASI